MVTEDQADIKQPKVEKATRTGGIFRVVVTCIVLRILLITYTIYSSDFRRLSLPKYQYNLHFINLNRDDSPVDGNKVHLVKSRRYLKGEYKYPVSTVLESFKMSEEVLNDINFYGKLNRNWLKLLPFMSWDGERFLKASLNNLVYTSMDSCAFFPLFPLLLKLLSNLALFIFSLFTNVEGVPSVFVYTLVAVVLNNILCVLNCVLVYLIIIKLLSFKPFNYVRVSKKPAKFTKCTFTKEEIERIAYFSCFVYNLSPGFVFTTSVYTEPIYSFFNYSVILLFLNSYKSKMGIYKELLAVFMIFISCFIRSNGSLLLIPLFFYILNTCPLITYLCNKFDGLYYAYSTDVNSLNGPMSMKRLLMKTLYHWLKGLAYLVVISVPFTLIQYYGYLIYCNRLEFEDFKVLSRFGNYLVSGLKWWFKNHGNRKPLMVDLDNDTYRTWCDWRPPLVYNYVQRRFWGVKLFYSLDPENSVHLLYTLPTIMVIMSYIHQAVTDYYMLLKGVITSTNTNISENDDDRTRVIRKVVLVYRTLNRCEFGLLIHLVVTMSSFLLFSHVQILFRQSLCLVQYILQFSIFINNIYSKKKGKGKHMVLFIYHTTLCFVGIILFSNFIGWT